MNLGAVKQLLYETVVKYHPGAMVVWEKTKGVKPKPPYITLGYSNLNRSLFPLSDDKGMHKYYNYSFTFEINLYTVGKPVKDDSEKVLYYENTVMEDLEEFARFLDSEGITEKLAQKKVSIVCNLPIRDLTDLQNDSNYRYRAMAEFTVSFVQRADGLYGIGSMPLIPNSSGGGTAEMAAAEIELIEKVEIQYDMDNQE